MRRPFEDSEFKAFVLSDALASRLLLLAKHSQMNSADVSGAARLGDGLSAKKCAIKAKIIQ